VTIASAAYCKQFHRMCFVGYLLCFSPAAVSCQLLACPFLQGQHVTSMRNLLDRRGCQLTGHQWAIWWLTRRICQGGCCCCRLLQTP
jgi:hypothetical protein